MDLVDEPSRLTSFGEFEGDVTSVENFDVMGKLPGRERHYGVNSGHHIKDPNNLLYHCPFDITSFRRVSQL